MKFRTGLHTSGEKLDVFNLKGKYFNILFEKDNKSQVVDSYEIIIDTLSEKKAQQAFEFFIACVSLKFGYAFIKFDDLPDVTNYDKPEKDLIFNKYQYKKITKTYTSGLLEGAKICCKASFRKKYTISIYKYYLACCIHSNYINDIDPTRSKYYEQSKNPLDHLRYSNAILIFYTIIEELQIEIRASNNKPSKIKKNWNPIVLEDLLQRIRKEKINPEIDLYWNLRHKSTNVHDSEKLIIGDKAYWANYNVRDSKIKLVDAISYLSWLRSKIIAHKISNDFMSISIYDVANTNLLIRKILINILT